MPLPHPQCLVEFNIIWICMHPSRPVVYSIGQQDGCLVCFYRALSLHLVDACPLQLHITLNQLSIATFEALPFLLLRASSFLSPCHLLHAPNHVSPRSFRTSLASPQVADGPSILLAPPSPPPLRTCASKGWHAQFPQILDSSPSFTVSFCLSALVFHFF